LLAGVGHRTAEGSNFLIVKQDTKLQQVEEAFHKFSSRDDVGIVLINQHIANDIRHVLKDYNATIPTVLEIPSKEHPYDPEQDYIMQRVNMFLVRRATICLWLFSQILFTQLKFFFIDFTGRWHVIYYLKMLSF
jgi:V-type H+-transporting ATPase subunit F